MKYITLFEQQTAFDNAKSTLDKPNMSLVTETGNVYSLTAGGGGNANVLMFSESGYQLYGENGEYWTFEYAGTEVYNNKEYFKYSFTNIGYILAPTRNITKVTFPFDDYYMDFFGDGIMSFSESGYDSLYGFTSVPENKILMKPRTDIGTNANGKEYVDLGLTSGTLWATMNVGATSETDYGSYFQWGDTVDKRNAGCSWSSYKYGDGFNGTLTKYCTNSTYGQVDDKTTLDLEDDAARANMGGDWRMPTHALIEELAKETNSEWVTGYNGTNINGRKFISKTDPSKYIFIPASGYREGSSFYIRDYNAYVWSSSLRTADTTFAWKLYFTRLYDVDTSNGADRDIGVVVRGVL